jgi:hypothetical protein
MRDGGGIGLRFSLILIKSKRLRRYVVSYGLGKAVQVEVRLDGLDGKVGVSGLGLNLLPLRSLEDLLLDTWMSALVDNEARLIQA